MQKSGKASNNKWILFTQPSMISLTRTQQIIMLCTSITIIQWKKYITHFLMVAFGDTIRKRFPGYWYLFLKLQECSESLETSSIYINTNQIIKQFFIISTYLQQSVLAVLNVKGRSNISKHSVLNHFYPSHYLFHTLHFVNHFHCSNHDYQIFK